MLTPGVLEERILGFRQEVPVLAKRMRVEHAHQLIVAAEERLLSTTQLTPLLEAKAINSMRI